MQCVLIADNSQIFSSALASSLEDSFQVITCADGHTALELLNQYHPDILIINLQLPYQDGLTVLQRAAFRPAVTLAITMYISAYVEQSLASLGVDYTMIAPSVEAVVLRLKDLLQQQDTLTALPEDIQSRVVHHLRLLNIPPHLDGYHQLCHALPLFVENPQQRFTKELYPAVAKLCQCSDSRNVERSIRKAILAAWKHRDNAMWCKYFPFHSAGMIPCPSNKVFICTLAEHLSAELSNP